MLTLDVTSGNAIFKILILSPSRSLNTAVRQNSSPGALDYPIWRRSVTTLTISNTPTFTPNSNLTTGVLTKEYCELSPCIDVVVPVLSSNLVSTCTSRNAKYEAES